jgi:hypothetical protein
VVLVKVRTRSVAARDESGAVAVLVAVLTLVLFAIAALVVDLGLARDTRRQAQNAADASALAAANAMYATGVADVAAATAAAKRYAAQNFGTTDTQWATCADPARPGDFAPVGGQTPCVSFKGLPTPTEVRVVMPTRRVDTPLAGALGITSVGVAAEAQAKITPGGAAACGLCVIGSGEHDLQNGDIVVSGASIWLNGTVEARNNGTATATGGGQIYLQGTKPSKGDFAPTPYENQPAIPDPLAFLTLPPSTAGLTAKTGSACGNGGPGIYRTLGISGNCTLQPGLYVVTGDNHLSGQTSVTAQGVTLYFTCQQSGTTTPAPRACNQGENGGDLLMTGQAELDITAPTSGPLAGLAIVADRNNSAEFGWRGNGGLQSTGTIYLKSGTLNYRGNGAGRALDSLIVVDSLTFNGNPSAFISTYTVTKNVQLPSGALHLSK